MASVDIDDAQAPHTDDGFGTGVIPRVIRAAMNHGIAHGLDFFLRYRLSSQTQQPCNSTHINSSVLRYSQATYQL
jgi:hypothetical protein